MSIDKKDLHELIVSMEGALESIQDVEGQAAIWWEEGDTRVKTLESLANSAYSEAEDVLTDLKRIRRELK